MRRILDIINFDKRFARHAVDGHYWPSWLLHGVAILVLILALSGTVLLAVLRSDRQELLRRTVVMVLQDVMKSKVTLGAIHLDKRAAHLQQLTIYENYAKNEQLLSVQQVVIEYDYFRLIALPTKPIGSIKRIAITSPIVKVKLAKSSNIYQWLTSDRKASNDPLHAEVVLRNGTIYLDDQMGLIFPGEKFQEKLTSLNGRMLQVNDDLIPFNLSSRLASRRLEKFDVSGNIRLKSTGTECRINVGAVDLAYIKRFLPTDIPLALHSGRADAQIRLHFKEKFSDFAMTAVAEMTEVIGKVRYEETDRPFKLHSGQLSYSSGVLQVTALDADFAGVPLQANGTILLANKLILAVNVQMHGADAARLASIVPGLSILPYQWSGTAIGQVYARGSIDALQLTGHFSGISLAMELAGKQQQLRDVVADISYQPGTLQLRNINARAFGGTFQGQATVTMARKEGQAISPDDVTIIGNGTVNVLAITQLTDGLVSQQLSAQLMVKDLHGSLSGPLTFGMTHSGDISLLMQPQGAVSYKDKLKGQLQASLSAYIPKSGDPVLDVSRLDLHTAQGDLRLHGKLAEKKLIFNIQASEIAIGNIMALLDSDYQVTGKGYFSADLLLDMSNRRQTALSLQRGIIRLQDGLLQNQPFAELSGKIAANILLDNSSSLSIASFTDPNRLLHDTGIVPRIDPSSYISLTDLRILSGNRQLEVAAREITLNPSLESSTIGQWQVSNLTLSRSRISALAALAGIKLPIEGFVEGSLMNARYAGTKGANFAAEARGVGKLIFYRPAVTIPLTPEQAGKYLPPANRNQAAITLGLDKATIDFELLPYASDSKYGKLFPFKMQITDAAFEYEGLPDENAVVTITEGFITPDDYRLVLSGKELPLKNFFAFTPHEQLVMTMNQLDGRLLLPFDIDGSISIDVALAGRIADLTSSGAPLADIRGTLTGGKDLNIAGVYFNEFNLAMHFDLTSMELILDKFAMSPAEKGRDYQLSVEKMSLFKEGVGFVPNGAIRLRGNNGKSPAMLADIRNDILEMARNTVQQIARNLDLALPSDLSATVLPSNLPSDSTSSAKPPRFFSTLQGVISSLSTAKLSGDVESTIVLTPMLDAASTVAKSWTAKVNVDITQPTVNGLEFPTISSEFRYSNINQPAGGAPQQEIIVEHFSARDGFHSQMQVDIIRDVVFESGELQQIEPKIVLSRRGQFGQVIPGAMNFHIKAQDVNPALLFGTIPQNKREQQELLARFAGEMQLELYTMEGATTADPKLQATIEWMEDPVAFGVPFQRLSALLTLENAPAANGKIIQRLWIGQRLLGEEGASNIQLVKSNQPGPQMVEFNGFIPLNFMQWVNKILHPAKDAPVTAASPFDLVAWDEEFAFNVRVPRQSLLSIKEYLLGIDRRLKLSDDDGYIEGQLALGGTPANPRFVEVTRDGRKKVGYLRLQATNINLDFPRYVVTGKNLTTNEEESKYTSSVTERRSWEKNSTEWQYISTGDFWNETLPDRISEPTIELALQSRQTDGKTVNSLELLECSGYLDLRTAATKRPSFFSRLTNIFGKKAQKAVSPAFVAQGSVRLTTPPQGWGEAFRGGNANNPPTLRLAQQLRYDMYLKTLRAPIVVGDLFSGNITAYLHLGNNRPNNPKPELNGIIYADNSKLLFHGGSDEPFVMPTFAFNPDLSLFLQVGEKFAFKFEPAGAFLQRNSLYADLRFVPTGQQFFSPESIADPFAVGAEPADSGDKLRLRDRKPFLDTHSPIFAIHADSYNFPADNPEENGSYGMLTGTPSAPVLNVYYVLQPRKSMVQLPGGMLTISAANGRLKDYHIGGVDLPQLSVNAEAQGTVDNYVVKAIVDSEDFFDPSLTEVPTTIALSDNNIESTGALTFVTVSSPAGMSPLSHSEIYSRLIGFNSLYALVRGREELFSATTLSALGQNLLWDRWLRGVAGSVNLETISLRFDPNWSPVATITTPEFATSRYSAFRMGIERVFSEKPTWRSWIEYRVPNSRIWRNLKLTGEINSEKGYSIGLNYTFSFNLSGKSETKVTPPQFFAPEAYPPNEADKNRLDQLRFLGSFPEYIPPGGGKDEE